MYSLGRYWIEHETSSVPDVSGSPQVIIVAFLFSIPTLITFRQHTSE